MEMLTIPAILQGGGTILSTVGSLEEGNAAEASAKYSASILNENAGQRMASAQRQSIEARRQAKLVQSRAQALAAASGGGVSDPTVTKILSDIGAEGEYRAMSSMYEGAAEARGMKMQAGGLRAEGEAAKKASRYKAASTLLSQGSTLYDKYKEG